MNGTYSEGAFYFYLGLAGSRHDHFADSWFFPESIYPPEFHDIAFQLRFDSVPEPPVLSLAVAGGFALRLRLRRQSRPSHTA